MDLGSNDFMQYDHSTAGDSRYPSPGQDENEAAETSEQQKPAAKRKRENRYKNAPPAVLSVCAFLERGSTYQTQS